MNSRRQKPDALGGAINQLESLLQKQARGEGTPNDPQLPILDEIVDPDTLEDEPAPDHAPVEYSQAELENVIARLSEQLEMELETLTGLLKESMLHEFRKEMAAVLGVDAQPEDPASPGSGDKNDKETP